MENLPAKKDQTQEIALPPSPKKDIFLDSGLFAQAQRAAKLLSESTLVPDQYKNNLPNCFITLATAGRLEIDPLFLMQNSYVIHGRPGVEAKLKIALINTRGPFEGPVQWRMEGKGNDRQCTAYAIHGETGELCEATVTWEMVAAERWNQKPGSKWNSLPDLMFRYRSASFLGNLYCPEVTMGMRTVEELEDIDMQQASSGIYEPSVATTTEPSAADLAQEANPPQKKKRTRKTKLKSAPPAAELTQDAEAPEPAPVEEEKVIEKPVEKVPAEPENKKLEFDDEEIDGEEIDGEEIDGETEDFGWV